MIYFYVIEEIRRIVISAVLLSKCDKGKKLINIYSKLGKKYK